MLQFQCCKMLTLVKIFVGESFVYPLQAKLKFSSELHFNVSNVAQR